MVLRSLRLLPWTIIRAFSGSQPLVCEFAGSQEVAHFRVLQMDQMQL
jgi:hypothetical protein